MRVTREFASFSNYTVKSSHSPENPPDGEFCRMFLSVTELVQPPVLLAALLVVQANAPDATAHAKHARRMYARIAAATPSRELANPPSAFASLVTADERSMTRVQKKNVET